MDHAQFKSNQTAAGYVADALDEGTQEAFELHMMSCPECVEDVEVWRTIRLEMPRETPVTRPAPVRRVPAFTDWRMAASLVGAGVVGATAGWFGKATQATDLDSNRTVVFNVPATARGGEECATLHLATETRLAVLRVPGVARDMKVVALDSSGHELPAGKAGVRTQPDGSQLVQLETQVVEGRTVRLEARKADGSGEPLGCVVGETPAPGP